MCRLTFPAYNASARVHSFSLAKYGHLTAIGHQALPSILRAIVWPIPLNKSSGKSATKLWGR